MSAMERLGSMDLTWLQIERETNRMHVTGLLIFETPLERAHLEAVLRSRLLRLERFGQHVLRDSVGAVWESDTVILADHVVTATLPPDQDERSALEALVGQLASTPLEPSRPLWQLHLVENYKGGSALIARVHQCIADSIALIGVLNSLTDDHPTLPDSPAALQPGVLDPSFFTKLYAPLTDTMIEGITLSGAVWAKYWSLLLYPQQVFDHSRTNAALAMEVGKLMGLPDDSSTLLKGLPGGTKHASCSPPLPLKTVQAAAKAHHTTPDAILLACLTGALNTYLRRHNSPTEAIELRTLMPVNLRGADAEEELGNRGGMLPLELPVGLDDPKARLAEIQRRMGHFEEAYQAQNTLGLFNLIGQSTKAVQSAALKLVAAKSSALLCHVPASASARYLDGAKISEQMFWSPASGDIGLSISILRYNGAYQVGLMADSAMVPNPAEITGQIEAELLALKPAAPKPRSRKVAAP